MEIIINPRSNSTETRLYFDPIMHDVAFGIAAIILTVISISIFYTIYKINVDREEHNIQIELVEIKAQRIVAPPNSPNK